MSTLVERKARIFRFGNFPAKRWGITRDEFLGANGDAGEIPIGLDPVRKGHYVGETSVLDGETGVAAFTVEGEEVLATLKIPDWLDRAIGKANLKISAIFHPTDKTLRKIDLVEHPHIPDAVLFAEEHGEVAVVEGDEPEPVAFDDPDGDEPCDCKAEFAQTMHDLVASKLPALCRADASFADAPGDDTFRQVHDNAVHAGAFCPGMMNPNPPEVGMSEQATETEIEEVEDEITFSDDDINSMDPMTRALYRRMQKLEGENTNLKTAVSTLGGTLVEKDAVAFADEITKGPKARLDPAMRAHVIRDYKQAAADDARLADVITFSDEKGKDVEGSRLDALKARYLALPRSTRRDEKIAAVGFTDLPIEPSGDGDEETARQKRREETQAWAKARNTVAPTK